MSEAIPSWARVGAKIVCVDASNLTPFHPLERNGVYEIRTVRTGIYHGRDGAVGVTLVGVVNGLAKSGKEHGYHISRFRPLVSQADDIATHFAHHLDTRAPEKV